jgi:hypothetical protein
VVKAIPQRTGFPTLNREVLMGKENKEALQVTKEIIVKFIETQRISPSNFAEHFPAIYKIVLDTLEDNATQDDTSER